MPYVNVKTAGSLSKEQKQQLADKITSALEEVANKPKDHTYVVFDEVDRENWAVGDKLLSER
jgi:4-oxalocrotonate tautomerase